MPESRLEELRRTEADTKKDWEPAIQVVRIASEEVRKAHQRYLQACKAVTEESGRPVRTMALAAKTS